MQYDVSGQGNYVTLTDISRTVDINNLNEDKVSYYTYYNIQNGDRPDIISQKLYGNPNYYWTFFILNDQLKTGINNSWPLSSADLENMISDEYDEYSAIVISPELTFQNKLIEGHGDFSVIPLDSQYLTSLKITDSNNMYKANILKYDYALLQLVVHNIVEISTGKTSSAIKNAFLNSEQYKLIWENAYEVTPVAASLLTGDSISNNQIKYTALQTGTDGNNISIAYYNQEDALNQAMVDVTVTDNAITVGPPAAKARMIVSGAGFAGVNGTYIYNGLVTLAGALTKQWKLDNGWPSIPSAPKVTISFAGSYGSWAIYYNDVAYYISQAVLYSAQPNPEAATYATYGGSASPAPTVTAGISTAAQVIAAINASPAAAALVTATASGIITGSVITMNQTFLSGGIDNVPTDAAQLALYAADVANKEEFISRVITQYDKIGNRYVDIVGSNGLPTKSQYVFGKDYYRATTLSNSSWEYYKYAPYQYFKLDEFDSSVTYPESVFSILNKLLAGSAQDYSPYYLKLNGVEIPFYDYGIDYSTSSYTNYEGTGMPMLCTCPTMTFFSEWLGYMSNSFNPPIRSYPVWLLFFKNIGGGELGWTLWYFPESQSYANLGQTGLPTETTVGITNNAEHTPTETFNPTGMKFTDGTQIFAKPSYLETINNISYYEKEQLENDSKQKIKVVRPDLIRNFEKTYFSVLTS